MLGAICTVSFVYRYNMFLIGDFAMMSKSLSANSYALVAGSCLRLLPVPSTMHSRNTAYVGQILFVLTVLAVRANFWPIYVCMYGPFMAVIATLMTVAGSVAGGNWILEAPILRHFGRVSYSLYLWHHVLLWLSGTFNQVTIHSIGVVSLSWIVAEISTIYIEEPIREYFKETNWFKQQKRKIAMASA
jgi:peptidoglycan/LPS O-acetylase OafA/YrhL